MRLTLSIIFSICVLEAALAEPSSNAIIAEPRGNAMLEELRTAPRPKKQTDLDTLQLASAQRERSVSVEEKTNGLWQSWLTSVCDGCGDTPSYRNTVADDFANRRSVASRGTGIVAARQAPRRASKDKREGYGRRLYADLSPEAVGQIRRMPRQ